MPITALPSLDRTSATFKTDLDSYFLSALPAFSSEANALQTDVNAKQVTASAAAVTAAAQAVIATTQASNAAASAATAAAIANATRWVSGTTYALDVCVISPANSQTYRRKVAGAGTTDPSADLTNWARAVDSLPIQTGNAGKFLSTNGTVESWGAVSASALTLLATLTPTVAANVDALNVFNSTYDNYLIIVDGVKPSLDSGIRVRFAVAGVVDSGTNYFSGGLVSPSSNGSDLTAGEGYTCTSSGKGVSLALSVINATSVGACSYFALGHLQYGAANYAPSNFCGIYTSGNAVSGVRFYWDSGNFQALGKIRIYGYSNT